ncbi:hypothetical protein [Sulfuricurvum sp.]|uniref:hypothetical protein n=1 Tax=Sulfuricurvum sp. TaxID=2025608 RepID=UPI003C685085
MLAYHLEIIDESVLDKLKAFVKTLPTNSVLLTPEKDPFIETLEKRLNREIEAPTVATHQEVVNRLKNKFAF